MSVTFAVDDVELGTLRLTRVALTRAVRRLAAPDRVVWGDGIGRRGSVLTGPAPTFLASQGPAEKLHAPDVHPFAAAIHWAYAEHLPLRLTPDQVWAAIVQGFATHVNQQPEQLRRRLVPFQGVKSLSVRRDDFRRSGVNPWHEVVEEFSSRLGEHVGELRSLLEPDFSTTTALDRLVFQILLMNSVRSYFVFQILTFCGIPRVTLDGTPADWESVIERTRALRAYDLEWWVDALTPVLRQFVEAAQGRVDRRFWSSICKLVDGSGGDCYSGWMGVFFPYYQYGGNPGRLVRNSCMDAWRGPRSRAGGLTASEFPSALSSVPVEWDCLDERVKLEWLGGFVGVQQDAATLEVTPALGWAIREACGG